MPNLSRACCEQRGRAVACAAVKFHLLPTALIPPSNAARCCVLQAKQMQQKHILQGCPHAHSPQMHISLLCQWVSKEQPDRKAHRLPH